MRHKLFSRPLILGSAFAVLLLAVLVAGHFLNWFSPDEVPIIVLPSPSSPSLTDPPSQKPLESPAGPPPTMIHVDVTVDNVQQILETLSRPDQYQCVWKVEWFWGENSAAAERHVFARDGWTKTDIYDFDGSLRHHHIAGEGRTFVFSQGFWQPEQGDFNADNEAALPTYEIIKALDKEAILSAEFQAWEDSPCVYVTFQTGDAQYVDAYWISYDDGLPFKMERRDDGETVIRCVRESLELTCPDENEFRLPNNQLAWDAE